MYYFINVLLLKYFVIIEILIFIYFLFVELNELLRYKWGVDMMLNLVWDFIYFIGRINFDLVKESGWMVVININSFLDYMVIDFIMYVFLYFNCLLGKIWVF